MTIDERLEKLAERHEALAQTVELLAVDLRQQRENIDELGHKLHQQRKNIDQLGQKVDTLVGVVGNLVRVARLP